MTSKSHRKARFASGRSPSTEDVRNYAAERGLTDAEAIESGMQEKRKEFLKQGAELCAKT